MVTDLPAAHPVTQHGRHKIPNSPLSSSNCIEPSPTPRPPDKTMSSFLFVLSTTHSKQENIIWAQFKNKTLWWKVHRLNYTRRQTDRQTDMSSAGVFTEILVPCRQTGSDLEMGVFLLLMGRKTGRNGSKHMSPVGPYVWVRHWGGVEWWWQVGSGDTDLFFNSVLVQLTVKPTKTHSSSLHLYCFLPLFHFSFDLWCLGVRLQLQDKPASGLEILSRFGNNSPTHPGCEMCKSVFLCLGANGSFVYAHLRWWRWTLTYWHAKAEGFFSVNETPFMKIYALFSTSNMKMPKHLVVCPTVASLTVSLVQFLPDSGCQVLACSSWFWMLFLNIMNIFQEWICGLLPVSFFGLTLLVDVVQLQYCRGRTEGKV